MKLLRAYGRELVTRRCQTGVRLVVTALLCMLCMTVAPALAAPAPSPEPALLELHVLNAQGGPLRLNTLGATADAKRRPLAITRLDLLLSDFALQHADGRWTSVSKVAPHAAPHAASNGAPAWHAFLRAEPGSARQALPPVQAGRYVAARFTVGVAPQANHADPNRLLPGDPLHPVVNGMHWGWTGGYVFMALEGHWQFDKAPKGSTGGFSYHLAGDANRVSVPLKGPFDLAPGAVLRLTLDAQRLLSGVDISQDGDATHSRQQDPLVLALKKSLPAALTLKVVALGAAPNPNPNQSASAAATTPRAPGVAAARVPERYPLAIGAHMPSVALPEDNPLTVAGVALGATLFADRRLSGDGSVSCASCHRPEHAFADGGKSFSTGVRGQRGQRNAMPLFNLAWAQDFFWDGRIKGLRQQVLDPIQHPHEMAASLPQVVAALAADKALAQRFDDAFAGPVTAQRIGLALEQFLLAQVAQDAKFDRVMKGADTFSAEEKRGFDLFLTEHDPAKGLFGADCFHCHGGSLFTNQRFMNNGLAQRGSDTGREGFTRNPAERGQFKTPSLRNVALTAPYMHDGRFQTLEAVVEHYNKGVQRSSTLDPNLAKHPPQGLGLSAADQAALVAFMRTLTEASLLKR